MFEEVMRSDPSYAPALSALAATYGVQTQLWPNSRGTGLSPAEAAVRMAPLIEKALEIDPMLAEAHAANGSMQAFEGRWADSEASFRRAIQLDPTLTSLYSDFYHVTLQPWGKLVAARSIVEAALVNDPLSLDLRLVQSKIHFMSGRYDEALANCQQVLAVDQDFPTAEEICARALIGNGRTDDALELFNKRSDLNEGWIGYVYAIIGRRGEAEAIAARNPHLPHRQALIYAALGDRDRAFEALERIAVVNPQRAGTYLTCPELAGLRGDLRFAALRQKMGFPPP